MRHGLGPRGPHGRHRVLSPPLLPLDAARRGEPQRPVDRPSLNLVAYERGRPCFYLLSELRPEEVQVVRGADGERFRLSSADALSFMHQLRASHDAILIGIGTLLSDDPAPTAQLMEGTRPRPVVLDTQLRFPLTAGLLDSEGLPPIIATNERSSPTRQEALEEAGAEVLRLPCDEDGGLALSALLDELGERGLRSVMVEGGASVITSFMRSRLVDHIAITMTPRFVGGMQALEGEPIGAALDEASDDMDAYPRLTNLDYQRVGNDLILRGDPDWE